MAKSSASLIDRMAKNVGREAAVRWWDLAREVSRTAIAGDPTNMIRELEDAADRDPVSPLAPAYRLWAADALTRIGKNEEAIAAYDRVIAAVKSAPALDRIDFGTEALKHRAGAQARAGDIDAAVTTCRELADRDEVFALYRAGSLAERAGRLDQAAALYREIAAEERTPLADDRRQRALRGAERLTIPSGAFAQTSAAAAEWVRRALDRRDGAGLRRLASTTHFQVGPGGGHFRFETEDVLEWLATDLGASRPWRMHRGLLGKGGKRYLFTSGWRGHWFENVVGFEFERSGRGWEWTGLVVNAPAEPWAERWAPRVKRTNQPLPFPLLAPWPEGRHFMAGGLPMFAVQSGTIAGALLIPVFGAGIAAALAFGYSLSDCGFGLRGFYYNEGPTHDDNDAFAIDFTAFRRGVPFDNIAGGTPVLSPADGIVRTTDPDTPSGDSSDANEVQIDHDDPTTGTPRFVSRYLHLAGPFLIPVSAGMPAPTGRRLGVMNDTGTSVLDHLHFSIHDSAAGPGIGPSVRPSPMEGHALDDEASGTCIRSSNQETIVVPAGCVAVAGEIVRRLFDR